MNDFGILGINRRNLDFIKKFNPKKAIRLADNKYETKEFLSQRWIPVPTTYALIKSMDELRDFDFGDLHHTEFVIKPNRGSKGRGIFLVKMTTNKQQEPSTHTSSYLSKRLWLDKYRQPQQYESYRYSINGVVYTDSEFKRLISQVFYGLFSLNSRPDHILVEQLISPGEWFELFCEYGLADIRVICFNLVPVIAMIRVPTAQSGGKANLAQGWIGLWVDIIEGKIKSMMYQDTLYEWWAFLDQFDSFDAKRLSFWNDILMYSSQIQYFINIGYLWLDRVITDTGPKLLEVNARSGMEIQKISQIPLKKVLDKIDDLSVQTPEKGLEISRSLFSQKESWFHQKIIYLSQRWNLQYKENGSKKTVPVSVYVWLDKKRNYLHPDLYKSLRNTELSLNLSASDTSLKHLVFYPSKRLSHTHVVLWRSALNNCLIKPVHKAYASLSCLRDGVLKDEHSDFFVQLDYELHAISQRLNISKYLQPLNYLDELDVFITKHWQYNPQFVYNFPKIGKMRDYIAQLHQIQENIINAAFDSPLRKVFEEKIQEALAKAHLLISYASQSYDDISEYGMMLYGPMDDELVRESEDVVAHKKPISRTVYGRVLAVDEVKKRIWSYLRKEELYGVKIEINTTNLSRISISTGKIVKIKLLARAGIREYELEGIIAHEIDGHLRRYLNGDQQWRYILKTGSGFYLRDEEWLAVYMHSRRMQQIIPGYINRAIYEKYHLIRIAQQMSFVQLCEYLKTRGSEEFTGKKFQLRTIFKTALKLKKWIKNTSVIHHGTVFLKDKVYLEWYKKMNQRVESWWHISQLMVGKIKIEDLEYFE